MSSACHPREGPVLPTSWSHESPGARAAGGWIHYSACHRTAPRGAVWLPSLWRQLWNVLMECSASQPQSLGKARGARAESTHTTEATAQGDSDLHGVIFHPGRLRHKRVSWCGFLRLHCWEPHCREQAHSPKHGTGCRVHSPAVPAPPHPVQVGGLLRSLRHRELHPSDCAPWRRGGGS